MAMFRNASYYSGAFAGIACWHEGECLWFTSHDDINIKIRLQDLKPEIKDLKFQKVF